MAQWGAGGYASRDGLSSRGHLYGGADQVQLNMGGDFDTDQEIDGLRSQVGRLKEVSQAIHKESQEQTELAESLQELLEKGQVALKEAKKRLNVVFNRAKSNHLTYLTLFAFVVIMAVWFLAKVTHVSKMIIGS